MQSLMKGESVFAPKKQKPQPVKQVTVEQVDNGGFIVSYYQSSGMGESVKKTYEGLDGVMKCLEETLGKKGHESGYKG